MRNMDLFFELSETEKKQSRLKGIIAAAIENKRYGLSMSQVEFAKELGISQGMVSRLESTECNMSTDKLIEILEKLGIQYSIVINGKTCISNASLEYNGIEYRPQNGYLIGCKNNVFPLSVA